MGRVLEVFGASVRRGNIWSVSARCLECPREVLDVGNSGLAYRFATALGALVDGPVSVTGDHSIRTRRPIAPLLAALEQMGARTFSEDGVVCIRGRIAPGHACVVGTDSQFVSPLLMTLPLLSGPSSLEVQNPKELPWIDFTLSWLDRLGLKYCREGYSRFNLAGSDRIEPFHFSVPADASSALFPKVAGRLAGSVEVVGVHDGAQGDAKALEWLDSDDTEVDVDAFIDAVPALAVYGTRSGLKIRNAAVARTKESNRLAAMASELSKMGAKIAETSDGLVIEPSILKGATVSSHKDHRIAMALAVAGLIAHGETVIRDVDCVAKTYPSFVQDFAALGAKIEEV